jgi:hypothetical protein
MQLSFAFFALWCATTAMARPGGSTIAERMQRRAQRLQAMHEAGSSAPAVPANITSGPFLNANGPTGETFNVVMASFVVPIPEPPTTGAGVWWGTAWVGIDGFTYGNAILQTGIDWGVEVLADGTVEYGYWGWYEWYPNGWSDFNFAVEGGDTIELIVEAPTLSEGYCAISNQRTGLSVSQMLTAPSNASNLAGQNAEWIVEDFSSGGLVPFADFGTVTFTQCAAGAGGTVLGVNASSVSTVDIINATSKNPITKVSFPAADEVAVTYI